MIILIDGNNLIYRAFYAHRGLSVKIGKSTIMTGGIFGFFDVLITALKKMKIHKDQHQIIVAWDKGHDRRTKLYPEYKQNRKKVKEDPKKQEEHRDREIQMARLQKILPYVGIHQAYKIGEEADDIVGTLAKLKSKEDRVILFSGDHDYLQLIDDNVDLFHAKTSVNLRYTLEKYEKQYEISPDEYVYVMSLAGDATDNIPGVRGIGEKTAFDIVMENPKAIPSIIHNNIDKPELSGMTENQKNKIYNNIYDIRLSYQLAKIDTSLKDITYIKAKKDIDKLEEIFEQLKFFSFLNDDMMWGVITNVAI